MPDLLCPVFDRSLVRYHLPATQAAAYQVMTNGQGQLVIDVQSDYISTPKLYVRVGSSGAWNTIDASADTVKTLNSLVGMNSTVFAASTDQNGNKVFANQSSTSVAAAQLAAQKAISLVQSISAVMAEGGESHSYLHATLQRRLRSEAAVRGEAGDEGEGGSAPPRHRACRLEYIAHPKPAVSKAAPRTSSSGHTAAPGPSVADEQAERKARAMRDLSLSPLHGADLGDEVYSASFTSLSDEQFEQHEAAMLADPNVQVISLEEATELLREHVAARRDYICSLESHPRLTDEELRRLQAKVRRQSWMAMMQPHGYQGVFSAMCNLIDAIIDLVVTSVQWAFSSDGGITISFVLNKLTYAVKCYFTTLIEVAAGVMAIFSPLALIIEKYIPWIGVLFTLSDIENTGKCFSNLLASDDSKYTPAVTLAQNFASWFSGGDNSQWSRVLTQVTASMSTAQQAVDRNSSSTTPLQNDTTASTFYQQSAPSTAPSASEQLNSPQNIGSSHLINYFNKEIQQSTLCFCASSAGVRPTVSVTGVVRLPRLAYPPAHPGLACITHRNGQPLPICRTCGRPRSFVRRRRVIPRRLKEMVDRLNAKAAAFESNLSADEWSTYVSAYSSADDQASADPAINKATQNVEGYSSADSVGSSTLSGILQVVSSGQTTLPGLITQVATTMAGSTYLADGYTGFIRSLACGGLYIPVISELLDAIIGQVRIVDLFSLILAFPTTVLYKVANNNSPPFSSASQAAMMGAYMANNTFNLRTRWGSTMAASGTLADPPVGLKVWGGIAAWAAVTGAVAQQILSACSLTIGSLPRVSPIGVPWTWLNIMTVIAEVSSQLTRSSSYTPISVPNSSCPLAWTSSYAREDAQ